VLRVPGTEYVVLSFVSEDPLECQGLTAAERDVASRLIAGETFAEIARARGSSVRTVSKQAQSVYRKAGVASRSELAARLARR
jgi:DNA-binding CsgD family transcriptional regulator